MLLLNFYILPVLERAFRSLQINTVLLSTSYQSLSCSTNRQGFLPPFLNQMRSR